MIHRVNSKLGVPWYPDNWHKSDTFLKYKNDHAMQVAILNIFWHLHREGGTAIITEEFVKTFAGWSDYQCKKLFGKLSENFYIGSDQKWSHESVTKRLKKSESASESNKKKWVGRYRNGKDGQKFLPKVDDNPINRGGAERTVPPPVEKQEEEIELPEWALPDYKFKNE